MLAAIIAIFAVIADQVTKYIVVQNIEYRDSVPFIKGFMSFYHTRNTGAAISMFSDNRWVFMVFSAISMVIIIYLLAKEYKRHTLLNVSLAMVLGGGVGNMIDRIRLGYVVDFFRTDFVDFAIFNVADCFITVGAVLLGIYVVIFDAKVEKRLKAEKEAIQKADNQEVTPIESEQSVEVDGENE